jgi:hypothetical protein
LYLRFMCLKNLIRHHVTCMFIIIPTPFEDCLKQPDDKKHFSGVMVSVLDSNVVDRGFEIRSGQTKEYEIGIGYFDKHA